MPSVGLVIDHRQLQNVKNSKKVAHELAQALPRYKQLLLNIFRDLYLLNIRNNLDRRHQERFSKQGL